MKRNFLSLLIVSAIFCQTLFAQFPITEKQNPEKEKAALELEKNALELLDQAVNEASVLKLSENRALIFAMAGDIIWSKDAKRGRELYRNAANEIIAVIGKPAETTGNNPSEMFFGNFAIQNLRLMVLQSLAAHDGELALELMQTTRPPDVAEEMQKYFAQQTAPPTTAEAPKPAARGNLFKAQQEIRLEQTIAARAAEQDPQKAVKMFRESLNKGFSYEIIPMLYKVVEKDEKIANQMLSEVIQKMIAKDYANSRNDLMSALNFLRHFTQPVKEKDSEKARAKLKTDDKTLKDLANRLADHLMKTNNFNDSFLFNSAISTFEKLIPERIAQLKQKQTALKKSAPDNFRGFEMPVALSDPNATAETMIADAAKADARFRGMIYRQAASRAIQEGQEEKIRALLQNLPAGKDRDDAISFIDARLTSKQLSAGKLDEARKLIDRMPVGNEKVEQIVALAVAAHRLNTKESKENALGLMEEARQMVKDFPEDKDETEGLLKVVAGFAVIDPSRAFVMLSPVIEQANELINASALLAKYNKQNQTFRDGELLMANNFGSAGSKFFRYGKQMKLLAETDFGRTRGLIDQFRREDVRVFAKMFIAQGILKEKIGMDGGATLVIGF